MTAVTASKCMHAVDRTLCIAADADDHIYLPGCPHLVPRASVMAAATAMVQSPAATGGLPSGMLGGRASAAGMTWASTGAAVPGLGRLPQQLLVRMPGQLQGQLPRRQPAASVVGGIASAAARVGAVATTATHADAKACSRGLGLLQPADHSAGEAAWQKGGQHGRPVAAQNPPVQQPVRQGQRHGRHAALAGDGGPAQVQVACNLRPPAVGRGA